MTDRSDDLVKDMAEWIIHTLRCSGCRGAHERDGERLIKRYRSQTKPSSYNTIFNKEQIDHMANRFLVWPLPESFSPDGGITFDKVVDCGTGPQDRSDLGPCWWPVGTNLFTAVEAKLMVEFMLNGLPMPTNTCLPYMQFRRR